MKNTNLLALLEAAASAQEPGKSAPEFENLGHELAQKLKGGQLSEDPVLNIACSPDNGSNTSCSKD